MVERLRMRLVIALRNGAIDVVIATDGEQSLTERLAAVERARLGGLA